MMAVYLNPCLLIDGDAREAITFYEQALQAKVIRVQTFGEAPPDPDDPVPDDVKDRIMYASLKVGETDLVLSDTFPGMPYQRGNQVNIAIVTDSIDSSKRFMDALAEGGYVNMLLEETFWSPAYGQVTDKFGVGWQINTDLKA
jgi:PhnB protein